MTTKVHAGMPVVAKDGTKGEVRAVLRNGRFLVKFATRNAWFSSHEKTAFEVA